MLENFWQVAKENPGAIAAAAAVGSLALKLLELAGKAIYNLWTGEGEVGADVDVEFQERPSKMSDWIVLRNEGDRTAENVEMTLEADGTSNPLTHTEMRKFPLTLKPSQQAKLIAATSKDSQPPYRVSLRWQDNGEEKQAEKTIYR